MVTAGLTAGELYRPADAMSRKIDAEAAGPVDRPPKGARALSVARLCSVCESAFVPKRSDQQHCSPACRAPAPLAARSAAERVILVDDSGRHRHAVLACSSDRYLEVLRPVSGASRTLINRYVATSLRTNRGRRIFVLYEVFGTS